MQFAKREGRDGKPLFNQQMVQLKLSEMHMLTEALRSFMLRIAWERDQAVADDAFYRKSANNMLALNFSTDAVQRVTHLNMEVHDAGGDGMNPAADKLTRDAIIWTHLADDSVNRIKAIKNVMSSMH